MGLALRARRRVRRGAVLLARWRARAGRRLWRARTVDAHCRGCAFAVWERVATGWAVQLEDTVGILLGVGLGLGSGLGLGLGPRVFLLRAVQVAAARRRFPYISPISRLYLAYISPTSRLYLTLRLLAPGMVAKSSYEA